MSFVLVIQSPEGLNRDWQVPEGEIYIGRDPANTIVLDGRGVSRRHAKLVLTADRLSLVDLGSTYGTRVNRITTLRRELNDGDEVTIGTHRLTIRRQDDAVDQRAWPITLRGTGPLHGEPAPGSPAAAAMDRKARGEAPTVQFVADSPGQAGPLLEVVPRHGSDLMRAVQRLHGSAATRGRAERIAVEPVGTEYQALLLLYRVSELLATASDLGEFLEQLADLVLEEVQADTVVLLQLDQQHELQPQVIRHRGTLIPGEIPISRSIVSRVIEERVAVMSNDVGHDARLKTGASVLLYKINAVVALPLSLRDEVRGVLYLSRSGPQSFSSADLELMAALTALVASSLERAELKQRVSTERERRHALERFHPPEVVERLAASGTGEQALQEHRATVLVCQLADFSALVGELPPRKLADLLREYYDLLYDKVFANGGSLVKLHDGWALSLFGAPHSPDRDAVWAVQTAKEITAEFESVAAAWPDLQLGCALDSGNVLAGVLGSSERLELVALGPPIATASAVVEQAKTGLCLTERTCRELPQARYQLDPAFTLDSLPVFRLRI